MTSRSHTFAKLVHPALSPGHRIASCLNQTVAAKSYSLLSHCYNKIRAEQRRNQSTFTAALTAVHNAFSDPSKGDPHSLAVGDPLRTVAKELNFQVKNLRNLIGSGHPALDTVAKYYTRSEGKYVRPTLVLLMSRATSFAPKTSRDTGNKATDRLVDTPLSPNIILSDSRSPSTEISVTSNAYENNDPTILSSQRRLAEITELIHIASLLHDDVIDHSVSRRSEPSANVAFGNKMAVLAGDFLLGRASVALARLRDPQVVELLATVIANLVEGEFMQLRNTAHDEKNPAWSDDALSYYLHKTYLKSASLISKSCRAAALLGNSAPEIVEAAYLYGKNIGLAFQLVDDMLDYTTSCSELGKPAGADLELGLATAPLLFAWKDYPELGVLAGRKFSSEGDVQRVSLETI